MIELGNEGKVHAFGTLLELESRAREFSGLVVRLKDLIVNQDAILPPDVVSLIDNLIWQLRKSAKLLPQLERAVGVQRSGIRRGGVVKKPKPAEEALRGMTKSVPIASVLNLLGTECKTGTLWIKTDEEVFLLEFSEGAVVHAGTNRPLPEHRLGTILMASNKVSQDRLEEELARANNAPLGETMLSAELVSEDDLRDALEHQVQELFHRINAIEDDARFVFRDGAISDLEKRVCLSTTQLLLESARASDERSQGLEDFELTEEEFERCLEWMGNAVADAATQEVRADEATESKTEEVAETATETTGSETSEEPAEESAEASAENPAEDPVEADATTSPEPEDATDAASEATVDATGAAAETADSTAAEAGETEPETTASETTEPELDPAGQTDKEG